MPQETKDIVAELRKLEREMASQSIADDYTNPFLNTMEAVGRSTPVRYGLSKLGQFLDVLDTGKNLVTMGLRPLVTSMIPDLEKVYQRYEKETGFLGVPNITPSALIEEAIPGKHWYKGILKFAGDVAGDPLTYLTFGTTTTAGKLSSKLKGLVREKEVIKLDSKVAKEIANLYGEAQPSARVIRLAKQAAVKPKTLAEQAQKGERALVTLDIPKGPKIALVKGEPVFKAIDIARDFVRKSKYGKAFNTMFFNHSSHPEFDQLRTSFINLMQYRKGQVVASAKAIEDQLDELSTKFSIPRDRVDRMVTDLVERPSLARKITKKVVTRIVPEGTEIKQRLVNVLRQMGESKAADYWQRKSVFSKEVKELATEAKVSTSPVARFMAGGEVYDQIKHRIVEPFKAMIDDVTFTNGSAPTKLNFLRDIVGGNPLLIGKLPSWVKDMDNWVVNTQSKYLRESYKTADNLDIAPVTKKLRELIANDLTSNKVTIEGVFEDLLKKVEKVKPTTKARIKQEDLITSNAAIIAKLNRASKLEGKLITAGVRHVLSPEEQIIYYGTHFFRPQRTTSGPLDAMGIASYRIGGEAERTFQLLRRGQFADMLKQSRGDVYDRAAVLINQGVIENRDILPGRNIQYLINSRVIYSEKEVLVKNAATKELPDGSRIIQKGFLPDYIKPYGVIPRGAFESEISEMKKLIYDTKQILPVVHGTSAGNIRKILDSGLIATASSGAETQARDRAAGVLGSIFASVPRSLFGDTKIILPVNFLEKATALPGDGLYLPANKMITQHLLSKGQDGIVDMLIRSMALQNWSYFQKFKRSLRDVPDDKSLFSSALDTMEIHPDIHLTGPIDPKNFLKILGPEQASVQKAYGTLQNFGIDISKMQLTQKNGRYFTRFFDNKGVPVIDQELLATPNLADALSRANIVGVGVDLEKQAAAIEKFIAKAKIPEGESVFTYLRRARPQLFAKQIEIGDTRAFDQILDNYGLLSDESLNAIGANILDIREGLYGKGLSARQILESPAGILTHRRIAINQENFQKAIQSIPGYVTMPLEEKGKLSRQLWRQVKFHERGHDVFTMGLRILPNELQSEFADLAARATQLSIVRAGKGGKGITEEKLSGVLQAYTNEGMDGAIKHLMGKTTIKAIKKNTNDYEFMKSVVTKLIAHVDELFSEAHSLYMINPKGLQRRWPEAYGTMSKIYQRKGWKTEWIIENTHIPRKLAIKHPEMFDVAQQVRKFQSDFHEAEIDAGVKAPKFTGDIEYTRHVITKEVRDYLKSKLFKGAREWSTEHQAQIMRRFRNLLPKEIDQAVKDGWLKPLQASKLRKKGGLDYADKLVKEGVFSQAKINSLMHWLTVDEVNALARQGKLKILGGKKVERFFDDNPAIQVKVRGIEGARARTSSEFYQASKQFGVFKKELQQGHKFVKAEGLAGWQFPEEIADHIDRYYEAIRLPLGVHPFVDAFDQIQDIWKAYTLAIFPAYHTRNLIGNVWNNSLAGLANPRYYKDARDVMQGGVFKVTTGYGKVYNGEEIIELAKRHNIWKVGQYGGDIEELFEREVKKASLLAKVRDNRVLQTGRALGIYLETNSYLAHFIWRLEQGYSPGAAAQSVKKYLFDYSDLTPFEKNVMKRIFPFYTWTRKNVPLQLEALVTQPRKPLGVFKAKNAIESNQDGVPDERYLPDWMVQNFPIRVRKDDKTGHFEYFLLGSWLPLADIDKIFRPDRLAMNMLTPLLKEPMQQAVNRDIFFGREIDQGGEYERLVGVNMPKRLSHLLRNIRILNEADKLTKKDLSREAKIIGLITGKLYPLDVKKEKKFRKIKEQEKERNISGQLKRAKKRGDKEEVQRVLNLARKMREERAAFKRGGG